LEDVAIMFQLDGVSFRYADELALDQITLTIPSRKITALMGGSGSGKSTVLRLLLGLIRPAEGVVRYHSTDISALDALQMRRSIGFLTQSGGLFPHLKIDQNVSIVARALRHPRQVIRARLAELCDLVRLDRGLLSRFPHELSGGQRQRAALMRALMLDPECLLLDEPFGALDPLTRFDLQTELKAIFVKLGKTVALVTHDLEEAQYFGDLIHVLHAGQNQQSGTYAELRDRPANEFVSRFFAARRQGRS
ncbi:MAG: ATP-binding cassette domain-containing protein, partial [Leptospirales bacterium]|nr:ATP-binding cassette domain-containing protein [Leptospirales bacterium]